jgi:hypothetical protein
MAVGFETFNTRDKQKPPMVLIHAKPGVGKTTLASEFPAPILIDLEGGSGDLQMTSASDGPMTSVQQVEQAVEALWSADHEFQTVIVDTLDYLEPLVWARVCEINSWKSIEEPGYGKGYIACDAVWEKLMKGFQALRDKGMTIVFLAHTEPKSFSNPAGDDYSHYRIRLHKRAMALFEDKVDVIGFLDMIVSTQGSGSFGAAKASGSGQRVLNTAPRPQWIAKSRFKMPEAIMINVGQGYDALAPYLPVHRDNVERAA